MRHSTRIIFFLFLLTIASRSTLPANPFVDVSNELDFFQRGPWGFHSEGLGDLAWLDYDAHAEAHLQVRWPSGLVETFPAVEANRREIVVEGTGTPLED